MITHREAVGNHVPLAATHSAHFGFQNGKVTPSEKPEDFVNSFALALKDALYRVNDLQKESDRMTQALAVRPNSVDIHDVTIAAEKARIALQFTKSIVDRITQSYRELINMR
jgi:flagellar hook-basal body complex protein FliE